MRPTRPPAARRGAFFAAVALAALAASPHRASAQEAGTVSASGTMRRAIAREDGSYRLILPPGRYELRARLVGYAVARESVTVTARQTQTRDFRQTRAATT